MNNNKVVFIVNHDVVIYNFRLEIVTKLLEQQYEVYIISPDGERLQFLSDIGCKIKNIDVDRHGINPIKDLKLIKKYIEYLKTIDPLVVLTFTVKPNIYGGIASAILNLPYIANITGLGTALSNESFIQKILIAMYKVSFIRVNKIYFQNKSNMLFFKKNRISNINKYEIIPGSGVNLEKFYPMDYPTDDIVKFVFISRLMKEKGINEYLDAAKFIKSKYPNTEFHICGFAEENYLGEIENLEEKNIVIYHGMVMDIRKVLSNMHCTILPSFYPEGISNVLLESAACSRPLISTYNPGCEDVVQNNENGYLINIKNSQQLIIAIEKFIKLSFKEKKIMGEKSRILVENKFSRQIVVESYNKEISAIKSKVESR